jgi:hypothetical protein
MWRFQMCIYLSLIARGGVHLTKQGRPSPSAKDKPEGGGATAGGGGYLWRWQGRSIPSLCN